MIRLSRKTRLARDMIRKRVVRYFGTGGLGLEEQKALDCCVYLTGGGGYISVDIGDEDHSRVVDILSKEWDYHAKRFMRMLA